MMSWTLRVCALLGAGILFFGAVNGFRENQRFARSAMSAQAEPIAGYTERTTTTKQLGIKIGESKLQTAEIFFTTQDRRRIRVHMSVPEDVLAAFIAGKTVYVEYLPDEPALARFKGHTSSAGSLALGGAAVLAATVLFWRRM
jgi:hypothetical protein